MQFLVYKWWTAAITIFFSFERKKSKKNPKKILDLAQQLNLDTARERRVRKILGEIFKLKKKF